MTWKSKPDRKDSKVFGPLIEKLRLLDLGVAKVAKLHRSLEKPRSSVIFEEFGVPYVTTQRVQTLVTTHIHHLED